MTEEEVFTNLSERGFGDLPITTDYLMTGELVDETIEIEGDSSEKHPSYMGQYINTSGEYWSILVYNGTVMAYPVSYNLQEGITVAVAVAESDTIMSYDCVTNTFFETVPNDTVLKVIHVERIDASELDKLTVEEMNQL